MLGRFVARMAAARHHLARGIAALLLLAVVVPAARAADDVRAHGALCDGETDDAAAFQRAYDALTVAGGTILVPAGTVCAIGGSGVEPRGKVELRCEKGSRIVALPGARAVFRTAATIDDWSVRGCEIDLAGVAVPAWESSGGERGGVRWAFRDNLVRGMPAGPGDPLSIVRLDCTLAGGPCLIANNTIVGSGAPERRDTCLTVGAGGFVGFNTQVLGNWIEGCGADCLEVRRPGGVSANDNVLVRCMDNAVDNSTLNSVWTGNQMSTTGKDAGAVMSIHDTIGNQVITGNQFAVNPRSSAPAVHAIAAAGSNVAGVYLDSNYAAQGVWFDARGRCTGGTCGGGACDDDAGCGACGGRCGDFGVFDHDHVANLIVTGEIRIESATNLVVQGNVVIGRSGRGPASAIRLVNPRADVPSGGIVVAGNQIGKRAQPGSILACVEIDDAGGGGFVSLTITGNSCGEDPSLLPDATSAVRPQGIRLASVPRIWRSVLIADNNFGAAGEPLVGFDAPAVRAGTLLASNLARSPGGALVPLGGPDAARVPGPRVARVTADVLRADAAPAVDTGLDLPLDAGRTYAIDGVLRVRAPDADAVLALVADAPQGATVSLVLRAEGGTGTVPSTVLAAPGARGALSLARGEAVVTVTGSLVTASSAGALALAWAPDERPGAPLVLQAASWLRATELP